MIILQPIDNQLLSMDMSADRRIEQRPFTSKAGQGRDHIEHSGKVVHIPVGLDD
ncbi:hypothetical protein P7B02_02575 [Caulobacter segnis]|nr:hypothetical protein [Caulobacter segnis]MDG2520412.1 hypothetical protein [Caulobacter segnis]